ncbi:MAG: carbon starvation protein A [Thermoguttaceae bacterium]
MNALWLVITALAAFLVAYRLYGAFLAARVAVLNDKRVTPAHRLRDDIDYQPTRRLVLFGVHFAAIAGPGPLIGPVLAAQWGFFPGFTWIVIGACLAGGVHDFVVLVASVRFNGLSLPKIARNLLGPIAGTATTIATLFIIVATLAGVAIVVVNALKESAWGMFTIVVTIPAALLTGFWMYKIRPGRVGEASIIGMVLVFLGVFVGKPFDDSALRTLLVFDEKQLSIILPVYAAIVSILPVWVLLSPRGYLSSYMKVGVIVLLSFGILAAHPLLKMPALTPYIHGGGPVVSGSVWPFVTIVIMCGALSGFHALIASGTTPKMVNKESDILPVGYGAMLVEGMVSITALIAACALEPGDYFKINTKAEKYAVLVQEAKPENQWMLHPVQFDDLKQDAGIKEELSGRTAGAVTLALGMAKILASLPGMKPLMAYLYHFAIMFEALFILTLLETGTRVARFIVEELIRQFRPSTSEHHQTSWSLNITTSVAVCICWGYLLYTGNIDRLWRMMGIANQLLATIGLAVGTTYLLLHSPKRVYALCTAIPFVFVVASVFAAGILSIGMWWQEIGLLKAQLANLEPSAEAAAGLRLQVFSVKLTCVMAAAMLALSGVVVVDTLRRWYLMLRAASLKGVELAGKLA